MNSDRLDALGLLARFASLHPVAATATGIHARRRVGKVGAAADAAVLAWVDEESARLMAIPAADLSRDDAADRDLALATLAAIRFERVEVRPTAWDPLNTVSTVGGGLFPLIARTFGSSEQRAKDLAARLTSLPQFLDASLAALVGVPSMSVSADDGAPRAAGSAGGSTAPSGTLQLPARPVSRLHTETAIAQAAGIAELAEMGVEVYGSSLRAAADVARAAADRFTERLRTEVLPRSEGEGRYGTDLYDRALRLYPLRVARPRCGACRR